MLVAGVADRRSHPRGDCTLIMRNSVAIGEWGHYDGIFKITREQLTMF